MPKKTAIGIDIDNVISDSVQPFADFWLLNKIYESRLFGSRFFVEKMLLNLLSSKFMGLFSKKSRRIRDIILKAKSKNFKKVMETVLLNVKPFPNSMKVINKLHKRYDVYLITTREYFFDVKELTYKWLKKNKIKIPRNRVIFCTDKISEIKRHHIRIVIEDHPKITVDMAEQGIKVYLFDYWFNRMTNHNNIIRISNKPNGYWHNVEKILLKK